MLSFPSKVQQQQVVSERVVFDPNLCSRSVFDPLRQMATEGKEVVEKNKGESPTPPLGQLNSGGSSELRIVERIIRESDGATHFSVLT
ncbi:conserved hypothetical protein [Ricinus communis]|uniref:Uncharacterized protein n=1 Tax=Ricinus communis TaxID=3988 RepID=B9T236_RICCO|nr:conserved hypothetical protein [Ricinus communis]